MTLESIRHALQQPLPGLAAQLRMSPPGRPNDVPQGVAPREAGVLLLLYPREGVLHFVLTRRTERLGNHSGQISFPGGRREPEDADLTATALREAREELGIGLETIDVLGHLTPLYVPPSHFLISPTVAHTLYTPSFHPHPDEVAEVIEAPLSALFDEAAKGSELRHLLSQNGAQQLTPHYRIAGHHVWGATAMVLSEFEAVML
ncbi:MAG: CoA pyrophosphatase [Anaerolineae bacterium]|nr:CoA pyrophosphatase [Anaerolineae bacterium]